MSPFGHQTQVSTQGKLASTCNYLHVRLSRALHPKSDSSFTGRAQLNEIWPGLNANEIQIPYDKHHKVSSLVKGH